MLYISSARSVTLHRLVVGLGVAVRLAGPKDAVDHAKQLVRGGGTFRGGAPYGSLGIDSCRFARRRAHTRSIPCAASGCPCGFVRCAACQRFCRCRDRRPTKRRSGRRNRTRRCRDQWRRPTPCPGIVCKRRSCFSKPSRPSEFVVVRDLLARMVVAASRSGSADRTGRRRGLRVSRLLAT